MIDLTSRLVTAFHHELVTPAWLARLSAWLDEQPALRGRSGHGTVTSYYNEERFMGPQSACKYMFRLEAELPLGPLLDLEVRAEFNFRAAHDAFRMKTLGLKYLWESEAAELDRETLASLAEAAGVLQPVKLQDVEPRVERCDKARAHQYQLLTGTLAGSNCVVIAHPLNLTQVSGGVLALLGEPAEVRAGILKAYGPMVPYEVVSVKVGALGPGPDESEREQLGDRVELVIAPSFRRRLSVRMNAEQAVIEGEVRTARASRGWEEVRTLLQADDVWEKPAEKRGLDGTTWSLRAWLGDQELAAQQWCPDGGPFLECCLRILTLAGFQLNVKRWTKYR